MAEKRYSCDVDEEISEIFKIKSLIEKNLNDIDVEKSLVRKQISTICENIEQIKQKARDEVIKIHQLKVKLAEENKLTDRYVTYVDEKRKDLQNLERSIHDQMGLRDFEAHTFMMADSVESAINFYSEETLQIELAKRKNGVREKRVEYTKLESEYNDMIRKLEEEKRERERQAELERVRKEEEARKIMEQEKIKKSEPVRVEQYVQPKCLIPPQVTNNPKTDNWMSLSDGPGSFFYPEIKDWKIKLNDVK